MQKNIFPIKLSKEELKKILNENSTDEELKKMAELELDGIRK